MNSPAHLIAILKGEVEGDPYRHFGSLLGFDQHLAAAAAAGLLRVDGTATDEGLEFYRRHRLADLPAGRANYWKPAQIADAAAELNALTPPRPALAERED